MDTNANNAMGNDPKPCQSLLTCCDPLCRSYTAIVMTGTASASPAQPRSTQGEAAAFEQGKRHIMKRAIATGDNPQQAHACSEKLYWSTDDTLGGDS